MNLSKLPDNCVLVHKFSNYFIETPGQDDAV